MATGVVSSVVAPEAAVTVNALHSVTLEPPGLAPVTSTAGGQVVVVK